MRGSDAAGQFFGEEGVACGTCLDVAYHRLRQGRDQGTDLLVAEALDGERLNRLLAMQVY